MSSGSAGRATRAPPWTGPQNSVAAVVIAPSDGTATSRVVALDLEDGSVVWDEDRPVDGSGYQALGGRLFHVDPVAQRLVAHR